MRSRANERWLARTLPPWAMYWAADSAVLLTSQALTIGATSAAAVLIARHVNPHDWGIFSGFLSLSLGVSILSQFGVGTWLLRELSRLFAGADGVPEEYDLRLVNAALVLNFSIAGALMVVAVAVTTVRHERGDVILALALLLVYGGLYAASGVMETHLRARRRVKRVAVASIFEKYLLVMLVVGAIVSGTGIKGVAFAYVVAGTARFAFIRYSVFGFLRRHQAARPHWSDARAVIKGSIPFAVSAASMNLISKLDTFVLLAISATGAGYFAIGDRLLGVTSILPATLSITLYPFFAQRASGARTRPWRLVALFGGLGSLVGLVGFLTAPWFVPLLFGTKYGAAVPAVRVFFVGVPLSFALSPLLVYGYSLQRERAIVTLTVGASLAGTIAIVSGQLYGGTAFAAGGYVFRLILFLGALTWVARAADRAVAGSEIGSAAFATSVSEVAP